MRALLLVAALGLAGCSGRADHGESENAAVPEASAPADPASPFEGTLEPTWAPAGDAPVATLVEVETGRHESFDRVVLEFDGATLPGYTVEYADGPVHQCGSGRPVSVEGDAVLRVRLEPARAHDEAGEATVADRTRAPGLPVLREATLICDFEAHVEWVLGLAGRRPYRVLELSGPTRLVVDVAH